MYASMKLIPWVPLHWKAKLHDMSSEGEQKFLYSSLLNGANSEDSN